MVINKIKERIDKIIVEKKLASSRQVATGLILSGMVSVGTKKIDKPGTKINYNSEIKIKKKSHSWVSRGALKLDHALVHFNISCNDIVALDIGCSTGGFTEVLIKKGAKKIYCVDVGYGQLDWAIRNNSRTVVYERTNARYLNDQIIKDDLDLIVCDASFISLKKILPASLNFLKKNSILIALIKPQFEIGKNLLGKGGVVKNKEHHDFVVNDIKQWLENFQNMKVDGILNSPIMGPKGNKEFLVVAYKS